VDGAAAMRRERRESPYMQFQNHLAVVTGAAKGIGEATVRAFSREGAAVALLDVDDSAKKLADSLAPRGLFVHCDVSRADAVERAFEAIARDLGNTTILVNNAGIQHYGTVTETSEAEWDHVLGVNLKSAFLCAKHAIPQMLKRGRGVVINLASVQAFVSQQKVAPYTTSKTALLGLTRSIAVDYAPKIRCVAVCPGTVDTPMLRDAIRQSPNPEEVLQECNAMHPVKRIATPEEVAELILYLASDKAGFITGQPIRIDGGLGLSIGGSKRD
jgi:NAD(P)-dependent dehydrogenase (short-subunit alcohol dehydrogenase family)